MAQDTLQWLLRVLGSRPTSPGGPDPPDLTLERVARCAGYTQPWPQWSGEPQPRVLLANPDTGALFWGEVLLASLDPGARQTALGRLRPSLASFVARLRVSPPPTGIFAVATDSRDYAEIARRELAAAAGELGLISPGEAGPSFEIRIPDPDAPGIWLVLCDL